MSILSGIFGGGNQPQNVKLFEEIDVNDDNLLSLDESKMSIENFMKADKNDDGVLDKDEFGKYSNAVEGQGKFLGSIAGGLIGALLISTIFPGIGLIGLLIGGGLGVLAGGELGKNILG